MKNTKRYTLMLALSSLIVLIAVSACDAQAHPNEVSNTQLESEFINPPKSIQTSVYWYWISDNISKEGAIKDLHGM